MKFIDSACAVLWTGLVLSCNAQAIPAEGSGAAAGPHNVVLFVADGLRAEMVRADTAPTMYAIRQYGVWFKNSHSLFPTFTTPNASALATGHYLGDTGDFGNVIYTGYGVTSANGSDTPFLESDPVLGEVNAHHGGNYLDEASVLAVAHARGYLTAAVGKLGPVSIQDVAARDGATTLVVDDMTGRPGGLPLGAELLSALQAARLDAVAPGRGANGDAGDAHRPGTLSANVEQQKYFVDVTTRALLPLFKATGKPFVLVFWSRDPDGTQHNQGDSLGQLTPGINGPSSLAGIRNADSNLAALLAALESLGLTKTTDVVVTADHGFSTISKQSRTSPAAQASYADVPPGQLPPGFLAIDLALALHQPLYDPDAKGAKIDLAAHQHPSRADGLIGADPARPEIVVAANGGSDLIYLPGPDPVALARQVVTALFDQDYVSGVFVDDSLGSIPGTLALSAINLRGSAVTPKPAIVVNFASRPSGCQIATNCGVEIADTGLQQGQGMHGSFSRADTYNFMAAMGPDFRSAFVDPVPASNADIGQTLADLLGLQLPSRGTLEGRILREAFRGGKEPPWSAARLTSEAGPSALKTSLIYETVGSTRYFDAAGFAGRTLGLDD